MRASLLFFLVLFVTSCSFFVPKEEGVIDEEKFIDVLVDIHFADAVIIVKGYRHSNDSTTIDLFYDDVLKKHNISRNALNKTINYYSKNINEYDRLYDKVLENLTKKQVEFNEPVKK